ncbi:MAG: hypothetical protein ACSHW4_03610 [Cellulophaga sp.]
MIIRPKFYRFPLFISLLSVSIFSFTSCSKDDTSNNNEEEEVVEDELKLDEDFYLNKDKTVANYILSAKDYNSFLVPDTEKDFSKITKKVYSHFEDEFDFIFILSTEDDQPSGLYYGVSYTAQNDVEGIGGNLYNGTAKYGSSGRLKSIIHMPKTEYIKNGPFLHEIMHYWGNYNFIETQESGHWGFSSVGGQLGGFDELIATGDGTYTGKLNSEEGFGTFANGGNSIAYGNAELYIMGLIGADELKDIKIAKNAKTTKYGEFTADEIITLTANDIVAKHGERKPSVATSQKAFNAIVVVISKNAISKDKLQKIEDDIENFSRNSAPDASWSNTYNFWQATKEKATLNIEIPTPKKE